MSGDDRQSELAQQHKQRQAQRAAEERRASARAKRNVTVGAGIGVVVVAGGVIAAMTLLGGGDAGTAATTAAKSPSPSTPVTTPSIGPTAGGKPGTCEYRKDDSGSPAKDVGRPPSKPNLKWKTMTIETNQGDIVIDLATDKAPCTVNSFAYLAKKNFFDGTRCHRLAAPATTGLALLQCGDPFAKGDGKSKTDGAGGSGYLFNDENLGGMSYDRGTVFMAQGAEDANSNGSQFAISYANDTTALDAQPAYTPFGKVSKGMDVIDKIVKGGWITNEGDARDEGGSHAPKLPVIVKDLRLAR
ncbi:peptidylprolyl isomerase [Spongiactinospora gelatinilytica]|uniref:Peptidylprolyl isomerase n=1 Tax=Spongiactinospora gelatinilytica TaxID=2666298 RepID=A0A2W2GNA5_9ACTN|nr:peptidylprolyl isomerase [Spongiactinospora gelatinilytica]PZG51016.1 peptidylprolyl isomerase [Spongiactinospora gelatinilytica]